MQLTKSAVKLVVMLTIFALVVTACTAAPAQTTAPAEESTDDMTGSSIEVMAQWGGPEQAGFEEVLAAFTEATGIEVTYISERDLTQVLPTRIAGGNPPDIALISRPGQIQEFVLDDVAVSYADLGVDLDAIKASYAQSVLDLGTFDGDLYGLMTASNSKSTFWYKPGSFEEQGFEEPETWDELMAIVDGYVAAGKTPLSIGGLDGWTLTDWFENLYVRVAGPENYVKLFVTHELEWTDPTVVQTMELFGDIVSPTDEKLAGGAEGANSTGFIDAWDQVLNDQAEMYYEGGFMGNVARDNFPDLEGGVDYSFFPFPEIDPEYGKPVVGGGDFAIAFTNRPETAAFVDFMASTEANEIWAQVESGARITPNKNVSADLFADPLSRLEAASIKSADIFVFDGSDLAPSAVGGDAMFTGLQQFLESPDNIQGILEFIESAADGAY